MEYHSNYIFNLGSETSPFNTTVTTQLKTTFDLNVKTLLWLDFLFLNDFLQRKFGGGCFWETGMNEGGLTRYRRPIGETTCTLCIKLLTQCLLLRLPEMGARFNR